MKKSIVFLILLNLLTNLSAREEVITNTTVTQDTTVTIIEPPAPEVPTEPESTDDNDDDNTDTPVTPPVIITPPVPTKTVVHTQNITSTFNTNITKNENSHDKKMIYNISFDNPLPANIRLVYYINKITSSFVLGSDIDKTKRENFINIPKGATSAKIEINVLDDNLYEPDEKFDLALRLPGKYITYSDGSKKYTNFSYKHSYGTIIDNDSDMLVDVFVPDKVSINEKDANTKDMEFVLNFSKPLKENATLKYKIIPNDITMSKDIQNSSTINYISLHKGDTKATIKIKVLDDNLYEQTEYFQIKYYPPNSNFHFSKTYSNAEIDDDEISVTISDYVIFSEDEASTSKMKFNIAFSKELPEDLKLDYIITPGENLVLGKDIKNTTGTGSIIVPKGSKNATIKISVIDDDLIEDAEYFTLTLKQPSGSYGFINKKSIGVILDDDVKIDIPTDGGDYIIYESGTTDSKLKTKIVNSNIKYDVYASDGFEIFLGQTQENQKTCDDPVCSIVTLSTGQKVRQCVKTCYITTTKVLKYSDAMDIDSIDLRTFKNYDATKKQCYGEYPKKTIAKDISLNSGGKYTFSIPSDKAFRCAWIEVKGHSKADVNGTVTNFKGISDTFAIRPDRYKVDIEGKSLTDPLVSGKNVEMKVMAVDASSNIVNSYSGKNFVETVMDKYYGDSLDKGLNINGISFVSGLIKKTVRYNDVGELTVTISEKTPAYAEIDKNDNPTTYKITPATYILKVVPDHFDITFSTDDANPTHNITFLANNPGAMGSKLNFTITAKNALNNTTTRYVSGKYADDVNLSIFQKATTDKTKMLSLKYIDLKSLSPITKSFSSANPFTIDMIVSSSDFISGGKATSFIKENFARDYKIAVNPILLDTKKMQVQEKNGVGGVKAKGSMTGSSKAHFYYGRSHIPSPQLSTKTFMDATVYYEVYCKSCDKSIFTQADGKSSVDSIYWYILDSSTVSSFGGICDYTIPPSPDYAVDPSITVTHQSPTTIKIVPPSVPHANKIFFVPSNTFLQYSKFGSLPIKHHFTVKFSSGNSIWAGEGSKGSTVDTTISKKSNQAIDW